MLREDFSSIFYIFFIRLQEYKSIDFKEIMWENKMAESIEPHSSCTITYLIFMKLLGNIENSEAH